MLIRDILLSESYGDELLTAVRDLLTRIMAKDIKKISTDRFRTMLAKQGFVTTTEEVIQAVDASGFASSVNRDEIIPADEMPADMADTDDTPDVSDMANGQAMKDVKAEL